MKINNLPILSICIPTYNRAVILDKTINSIVNQRRFRETNDVEIVISDNCSDDNTSEVVEKFLKLYPDKIVYNRNDSNISDANFEKVLSFANGIFLKLNNDTLIHKDGSLDQLIWIISNHIKEKDILFILNGISSLKQVNILNTANEFLSMASFWITWIGAYGFWKQDFERIENFTRYSHLQLAQIDVLFSMIKQTNKRIYIYNYELITLENPLKKGGYDIITVFIDNYSFILKKQVLNKIINMQVYKKEMNKILMNYICFHLVNIKIHSSTLFFEHQNAFRRINKFYIYNPFLLLIFYCKYILLYIKRFIIYKLFE
jgi:glycosyltransferase involved in cell wall biosynthesis